ncbi:MAG TPA: isopeptide-forming domain-containing fimbrial protein, partial [Caldilineaceae bacterium]|nr:isopeptide-forming domain-containing fimbrial protein [Caldilineaceae bacterium]
MPRVFPPHAKPALLLRPIIALGISIIILLATLIPAPMLGLVAPILEVLVPPPAVAFAQSPTLELTKQTTTATIASGTPFEYVLTYKCASITTDCLGVTIEDILPADLEYVAGTATTTSHIQGVSHAAGTLTWTFVSPLPAGSTGVLRFSAQFKPGTLPGTTAQNEASIVASNAIGVVAQSTVVTAEGAFEMFANKSGPADVVIGFPADFDVGICSPDSSGGIRLTNPVITDTLPANAFFVDAQGTQGVDWTYTPAVAPDQGGEVVFTNLPTVDVGGCLTRRVTLRYDSDPGATQTNAMAASGEPEDGSPSVLLTDTYDFGVIAPYAEAHFGKSSTSPSKFTGAANRGHTEALPGEAITYTVSLANTGYLTLTNGIITDVLPSELDLQSWQVSATITKPVSGFYQINNDGNWLPLAGNPYTTTTMIPVSALGLGGTDVVTHLRWDLSDMDLFPTRTPAYSAWVAGTANGALSVGTTFNNCAIVVADELGSSQNACDLVEIIAQRAIPRMSKSNSAAPFLPLAIVDFTLSVSNAAVAHLDLENPVIADLLVPELTFLTGTLTFDNSAAPGAPAPNVDVIDNYNGTGRTLLRWGWNDQSGSGGTDAGYSLAPGAALVVTFQAQVVDGTAPGSYINEAALLDWGAPGDPGNPAFDPEKLLLCSADTALVYTDTLDLDGDSFTTEISCLDSSAVNVPVALSMESEKFVRGTLDCQNTTDYGATTACEEEDYNKLGLTVLGGDVDYRLIMTNTSNVSVTKITLIDIFPYVGDTGVIDPQARQSLWGPNLQAPVNAPSGVPLTIYYSTEENPCRTELVAGGPGGCTPANWTTTFPSDPTSVNAIKIEFCDEVNPDDCVILSRGSALAFDWHMVAPNIAPTDNSCLTPAGDTFDWQGTPACPIAWNSFGFTAFEAKDLDANNINDVDALQLPPTEPIRVGMRIAPDEKYSLGDYVWLDVAGQQDDGIQQAEEVPDWGISGIRVELYDSSDTFIDYRYTGPDQNGDPGYYQFSYLNAGDYYLRFFPPAGYTASPQQVTGTGHDLTDSDGVSTGSDVTYGAYWQTETFVISSTTTISNHTPAWDFALWVPVDYGDAPSNYPVEAASSSPEALAARHIIVPGFYLGSSVDGETDGQPGVDANGDDSNGSDDEDGVVFPNFIGTTAEPTGVLFVGKNATLTISGTKPVTQTGYLNAWIDWNGDGTWAADEQIATDLAVNGTTTLNVNVPGSATTGTTYARFRYGSETGIAATGIALDGEVEDYKVVILTPSAKAIAATSAIHTTGSNLTIGEVVRYRMTTALPEGILSNFRITDTLPSGLQYSNTVTVSVIADTGIISGGLTVSPALFGEGTDPVFDFGTVTNNDNDSNEEYLIIEFDAVVLNVNGNQAGTSRSNSFVVSYGNVTETSNTVAITVVEPVLALDKQIVSPLPKPLGLGGYVTYTLILNHSGSTNRADAFDVVLTDTVPVGLDGYQIVSVTPGGSPAITAPSAEFIGNTLRVPALADGSFDLPRSATVTIVYRARLAAPAQPRDIITNGAGVVWSSLDGADPHERNGGGTEPDGTGFYNTGPVDDYERADDVSFTVPGDWGDAPNSYATSQINPTSYEGPSHYITSTLYLGARVDDETNGQPNATATGDDLVGSSDDEDGITFLNPIVPRRVISTQVTVHNTSGSQAYLNGWLDFDHDGTFTQGADQIFDGIAVS